MATVIRPEVTKRSPWYLEKHRYYELKHFCLQCPTWRKELTYLDGWSGQEHVVLKGYDTVRPSEVTASKRIFYSDRIAMLEQAANDTDSLIGPYILEGILNEKSYDTLNALHRVPACRDVYYELYRKFFYILSNLRQ